MEIEGSDAEEIDFPSKILQDIEQRCTQTYKDTVHDSTLPCTNKNQSSMRRQRQHRRNTYKFIYD